MIKIISRKSDLAVIQANLVGKAIKEMYPEYNIEYVHKETRGDIDLSTPLSKMPEAGVFTTDLRDALIVGDADLAVHSWKDLPVKLDKGTVIAGTLPRADMRDILLVKKSNLGLIKKSKSIDISTSSPRRSYNINSFLPQALPIEVDEIIFSDIRGNIPTRLDKFIAGKSDGIVLAKAALDRILINSDKSLSKKIRSLLKNVEWMVLPLSENPCAPAQGALAIEVNEKRHEIINIIKDINNLDTFNAVQVERDTLSSFGGGCHQKIGVSNQKRTFGDIFSLKGISDEGEILDKRVINRVSKNKVSWGNIDERDIFPSDLKSYNLFSRANLKDSLLKISALKNKNILASRGNVLEGVLDLDSSNNLWTSGVQTWFNLAKKGFWVNGTFDSLGEAEDPQVSLLSNNNDWLKLTHEDSMEFFIKEKLPTYKLIRNKIKDDLSKKTHFFWMSGSAFLYALEEFPDIINKFHSCGPGNTYEIIKKNVTEDHIKVFLSYNDWKSGIINE
jgi:hydroxymethylbilane synthase